MSGWWWTVNRDGRHVDIWPDADGDMLFTSPIPDPAVSANENWCFDCGQLVSTHPGWFPTQALFEMYMHWGTVDHPRLRVVKSKESGRWLVKRGEMTLTSFFGWQAAMFVAFERHPWTKHLRAEKRLRD